VKRDLAVVVSVVLVAAWALAEGPAKVGHRHLPLDQTSPSILVEKNVEARMRDGVILRADVYRPDTTKRLPALLERTPYSKNPEQEDTNFKRLASRGFVVVVQDTRGRYTSDGVARPHDEGEDGYDTIEWVAQLPYVNDFPRFDRNPNTGATLGESAELLRAQQTIFHDAQRPSRIVLPIVPK
jgi:predicted acyl esterase